jgi:hypothetical protein
VDGLRDQLLAGAALATDQDCGLGRRNLMHHLDHGLHGPRVSHQARRRPRGPLLRRQTVRLALQTLDLFHLLAPLAHGLADHHRHDHQQA